MTVPAEYSPVLPDDGPSDLQRWRDDYRRGRARRSTALAGVSTVVFLTVVGAAIVLSPGWPRVKATFLDWEVAKDSLPDILLGLWLNIRVLAVSAVLIVVVGLGIAALRTLRGPLWFPVRALAAAYTDFFRGMPLIILLYLVGLRAARTAAQGDADLAGRAGHHRAGAHLLGVRRGGLPGRHRVGAPEPAGGGPVARAVLRADDAPGGASAGRTPGDPAAAQRLRGPAEGRRA